ncbi:MAG: hypothetical protein M1161_02360 [Candidatus Thermoplasmatota archaeon]|nr:hypothetical protein [Candidatus Thermoplasmatota archaeon]
MKKGESGIMYSLYKDHRELQPEELNSIIFAVLKREYPKKVKNIVSYAGRHCDELGIVIENPQSLSGRLTRRLEALKESKRVVWTPIGWKLP